MGDTGSTAMSSWRGPAASPLLRAKLRAPGRPNHFVRRPRLYGLLDELVASPLTIVVAPAGAGKTLLLSGWLAESSPAHAWLSLDESDREGFQLWSGIIAALQPIIPGCGQGALALLRRPAPLAEVVIELLNDLEDASSPECVLVLDDLHLIDADEASIASLGLFLLHLPEWLHVVVLSRRDPNLPIDRLRGRGQLAEVRFAELRLAPHEAAEMLSLLAPSMSADEIDDTISRSDGWAAGLQLMALAARSSRAQEYAETHDIGRDLMLDQFVWHEVLGENADEVVTMMLEISVVERVSISLAQALTGRLDVGQLLNKAEARGLFVTALGGAGWFQIHALVRAALLAELTRRSQQRLEEGHARAAKWFEDSGEIPLALEHWLLAGRPREALRVLTANHAALYDAGREATIRRTIAAIPASVRTAGIDEMFDYAWCQLLVSRRGYIDAVQQAGWWFEHGEYDASMRCRLSMLRSVASSLNGDWTTAGELAREAMLGMGEGWLRDPLGRYAWNQIGRAVAYSEAWSESCDDVRDADLALSRDLERRAALEGTRAVGLAFAGQPVEALRVAAGVRRAAEVSNMTILRIELAVAEAIAHRELGDRSRALSELRALAESPMETMLFCRVLAILELVEALVDSDDLAAAATEFERAEALIAEESLGDGVEQRLARVGTLLELRRGEPAEARRWAERLDDSFWRNISIARVELTAGSAANAVSLIDAAFPRCVRHEVIRGLLRARAGDDFDESVKHAAVAIELAAANDLLQTVGSEGPDAYELIERAAWRVPPAWMDRLRRLVASGAGRPGADRTELVEQLTDRERDVLRYLPSRLTIREIADELYVSVNTLKFHLKVIYRKLGVASRAEAAAKARQMMAK